jgi:hypothetical protein
MTNQLTQQRTTGQAGGSLSGGRTYVQSLISVFLGIALLLPASFFLLTLLVRIIFGAKTMYHFIAPSFLQSPFDPLAWHKAQFIMGCLLLAILLNGSNYRRHWLNMAIAVQGFLLMIVLIAYTLIQHIRY